jgi:hypothetical protein
VTCVTQITLRQFQFMSNHRARYKCSRKWVLVNEIAPGLQRRLAPIRGEQKVELEMRPFTQTDVRSDRLACDHHFLHTNVILRHAGAASGEAEDHIDRILTEAAVAKRRVWVSSILFAELRPSMFVPGRFETLDGLTRYIRSIATVVTPDPNTMLRVARLRDAKWQRPACVRTADEKPRTMSLGDAIQIGSALWVKEAGGVPDLKFVMFDDSSARETSGGRLSLLRLQDYAADARANSDVMAAVRLTRIQPLRQAGPVTQTEPV